MAALLTIGEFSRVTHLSVKALRHYDDVGLLRPAEVDAASGYRRYASGQVPVAHVIRRFRDLDMPLDRIRVVLEAPDVDARDRAIVAHLAEMERVLHRTQVSVASLRAILDGREPRLPVEFRSVPAAPALAITDRVSWDDAPGWLGEALAELHRLVDAAPGTRTGADTGLYSSAFFEAHDGEVVAAVPVAGRAPATGRARLIEIPAADLAVMEHRGPFDELDRAYGALGTYVAERVIGAEGPVREVYLCGGDDTDDPSEWRTEVCWPVRSRPDAAQAAT